MSLPIVPKNKIKNFRFEEATFKTWQVCFEFQISDEDIFYSLIAEIRVQSKASLQGRFKNGC